MARFDRYLLSQLMMLFGFFALVLVAIYWINSAVRLFDQLIADGQTAAVFLEYTALTLPNVIRIVLPVAAFAASVYVTNRLSSDSELVVMQATGFSPWRLARPVLFFGLIVGLIMSIMTNYLVPRSQEQILIRNRQVAQNVTARMLTEGSFLHPVDGITFYIRDIEEDGTLIDVFLSDRRDPERPQTFTADRAYIINTADPDEVPAPKLVMVDGLAQNLRLPSNRLFTTHFTDFSYDIGALIDRGTFSTASIRNLPTPMLLFNPQQAAELTYQDVGRALQEGHGRITQALLCVAAALIGFSALQVGSFSRFGVWRQILFAILLLIMVKFIEGLVTDPVRQTPEIWPILYLPGTAGIIASVLLLWWASRPRRVRRHRPSEPEAAA